MRRALELTKTNGGFTLVESVMAVMILGIAMGACMLSFDMAMKAVSTSGNQMAAMHYARDQVETIRTNSFSGVTNGGPALISVTNNFSVSYSVTNIDSDTKNVTVSVTYLNRLRGGASTNTLTTSIVSTLHK